MQLRTLSALLLPLALFFATSLAGAQKGQLQTGTAALADWRSDAPDARHSLHLITHSALSFAKCP